MTRPRPATFRPQVEQLEGRLVPNASRVIDAAGQLSLFVARADGSLVRYDPGGATLLFSRGVSWAQAYLDPSGRLGLNVVFGRSRWVVYDAAGGHDMGSNRFSIILSVSTAFGPDGQEVIDVVQADPWRGFVWAQYDAAGAHLMHIADSSASPWEIAEVTSASTAIDAAGNRVSDWVFARRTQEVSYYLPGQWHEDNPLGSFQKGQGDAFLPVPNNSPEGVLSAVPSFDATGALVYDIVRWSGEWDYYDAQGMHFMGTGVS